MFELFRSWDSRDIKRKGRSTARSKMGMIFNVYFVFNQAEKVLMECLINGCKSPCELRSSSLE